MGFALLAERHVHRLPGVAADPRLPYPGNRHVAGRRPRGAAGQDRARVGLGGRRTEVALDGTALRLGRADGAGRSPAGLARTLSRTVITTYSDDLAITSTLFRRDTAPGKIGRQMRAKVKAIESGDSDKTVYRALPLRTVVRLYPDLSLDSALRLLGNYPILPVVSRANANQLLGVITLRDVHAAYGIASVAKESDA